MLLDMAKAISIATKIAIDVANTMAPLKASI